MRISNKEKNFVTAVVYVNNSGNSITNFLEKLSKQLNSNFENYEIICVNDASVDDSVMKINRVANDLEGAVLSIINMSFYQGLEAVANTQHQTFSLLEQFFHRLLDGWVAEDCCDEFCRTVRLISTAETAW